MANRRRKDFKDALNMVAERQARETTNDGREGHYEVRPGIDRGRDSLSAASVSRART